MSESEFVVTHRRHDLSMLVAEVEEVRTRVERRTASTRLRVSLPPPSHDPRLAPTLRAIPVARPVSVPPEPAPPSSRPLPEPAASRHSHGDPSRR